MNASRPALILAALVGATLAGAPPRMADALRSATATPPVMAATAKTSANATLPWIADDYTRAVAEAKARKVPLFIEAWAPW